MCKRLFVFVSVCIWCDVFNHNNFLIHKHMKTVSCSDLTGIVKEFLLIAMINNNTRYVTPR